MKTFKGLLLATALFIFAYWTSVFTGVFPVEEITAGYQNWFMSFPLPDFYVATCALLTLYYLNRNNKFAGILSAMTGSGLLFLGLYALSYGHNTGLLYILTTDEMIEIAIKVYCISAGAYFVRNAWKLVLQ